jgi:flavin-binding protein dodecin
LRERFVLHWQSVRPVPRLTIDFGDGRKMQRTLTGNSIHYVIDSEGRLIDALPGMYGPGAFLRELVRASSVLETLAAFRTDEERNAALRRYHESRSNELENAWLSDVKRAGLRVAPSREIPKPAIVGSSPPSAQTAARAAISKSVMVERPILRGMSDNPKMLDSIGSDAGWSTIAALHADDATLDQATRALMTFKDSSLTGASMQNAIIALEHTVAEDTVRNEYVFRARIHRWLASGAVSSDLATLNERIYAELFLTPSWDAWLGLRPTGAYSGIDNDGIRK